MIAAPADAPKAIGSARFPDESIAEENRGNGAPARPRVKARSGREKPAAIALGCGFFWL